MYVCIFFFFLLLLHHSDSPTLFTQLKEKEIFSMGLKRGQKICLKSN